MRAVINLMLVIGEVGAALLVTLISLSLSTHFLGGQHVYFGILPAYVLIRVIMDVKDWAMDKFDDTLGG